MRFCRAARLVPGNAFYETITPTTARLCFHDGAFRILASTSYPSIPGPTLRFTGGPPRIISTNTSTFLRTSTENDVKTADYRSRMVQVFRPEIPRNYSRTSTNFALDAADLVRAGHTLDDRKLCRLKISKDAILRDLNLLAFSLQVLRYKIEEEQGSNAVT